jgi:hypothetical protein
MITSSAINMKKGILIGIILSLGALSFVVLRPAYSSWQDEQIVSGLEIKVVPFVNQNAISYFVNDPDCKQLNYGLIQAASPQGCAYKENVTDSSKKNIPDFTNVEQDIFSKTEQVLKSVSGKHFSKIRPEYTTATSSISGASKIGLGFHLDCSFCRVRYVYWPGYQSLPQDIHGEINYTQINNNWYRVDEDWN